ncbi:hypothetical protein BDW42DRAFT_176845 [Aspergillus taichungensis]|uniref:Uncharacterized protein n=1 Tax=Aspergillus taichungensis TaxID=482145 RepID=A0A2J5HJW8_9EURO|nr:hypothetical protein BDW42DRAFT_176845 [Aspergillus taichungensis]
MMMVIMTMIMGCNLRADRWLAWGSGCFAAYSVITSFFPLWGNAMDDSRGLFLVCIFVLSICLFL